MKEIKLKVKPKLFLSEDLLRSIKFLHKNISNLEWSGMLLCRLEGSLKDLNNLEVYAENVYPCNIGSASFTTYSHADHIDDVETLFPEYSLISDERWDGENCTSGYKLMQIHTHHNMEAFFSGTDMQDLYDNTSAHGFYISLIVNYKGNYVCKGSFMAKSKTNTILDLSDYNFTMKFKEEEENLVTFDFDIQDEVNDWMENQLEALFLKKEAEEAREAIYNKKKSFTAGKNYMNQDPSEKFNTIPVRKPFIHSDLL